MADNFTTNAGAGGKTFASDEIGGVDFPRVKLVHGADGVNAGDVATGNPLPISDAGGSLTVDGSVSVSALPALPTGDNTIGRVKLSDGTEVANVTAANRLEVDGSGVTQPVSGTVTANLGTLNGVALDATLTGGTAKAIARGAAKGGTAAADATVSSVDADHNAVDVFVRGGAAGGGTEYVVNAVAPADPTGPTLVAERDDQLAALAEVEGDWTNVRATAKGALWVAIPDSNGDPITSFGGGTQYTEDAAAAADPIGTALNLIRDDARAGSLTTANGDNVAARGTNSGELYVKHVDAIPITDNGGSLTVDNPILSVVGGGTEAAAQRVTIASDSTGVLSVDDNGASLTVDGTVTANAGTGTMRTDGGAAHDSPVAGNPNLVAGRASAAAPADVSADGDAVNAWRLRNGAAACVLTAAGALIGGDATNGLDVDITRLPALVAGTANIGDVDVLTVPAPLSTSGGGTEATALRVTLANDSTGLVSVDDNGGSLTVDGTVTAAGGAANDSPVSGNPNLVAGRSSAAAPTDVNADGDVVTAWRLRNGAAACVLTAAGALIGGDATNGLDVDVTRVGGTVATKETRSATGTVTSVADNAASSTLLASNANRLGASIVNDSSAVLYVRCEAAAASTTAYSARLVQFAQWEAPFGYTGEIRGIWATDPGDGAARITEYT